MVMNKDTLIGAGIAGILLFGGYTLFNSDEQRSDYRYQPSYEYDADYSTTRSSLSTGESDRDCGDFSTHAEAQDFFESAGPGDPHGLDRDGDGEACETLP